MLPRWVGKLGKVMFFFQKTELKTNFLSSFSCYSEQSVNPYIVKLSIVDDEATLNVSIWLDFSMLLLMLFHVWC